jgi:Sodium:solute symporter family
MPVGLIGMFFAAIIAIHLSTISSHLNLGALYATRDLYHHYINPEADEKKLVWVGRVNTLILLIGSFILGLSMENITAWLIFALWLQAAGIWIPSILQVIWWRFNSWGYLSSWIANLLMSWLVVFVLPELGILPQLPDWASFWLLAIMVGVVYIPVTLLTKPDDMDHLVEYYAQARPIGFWGPVRAEAIKRGLVEESESAHKKGLFAKDWSPVEADEWTIHDIAASVLSALGYVAIAVGVAGSLLLQWWGFASLVSGIVFILLMFKIIDPKLKAMSVAFEQKEKEYIERAEKATRWEA